MATPVPDSLKHDREARGLVLVLVALLVLAGASWALAHASLGAFAAPVALAVAGIKALLVAAVFMRLAHSGVATRFALAIAVAFIVLLAAGVSTDVLLR